MDAFTRTFAFGVYTVLGCWCVSVFFYVFDGENNN